MERDGAEPDAERHGEPADDRQPRVLHQHPAAELQVEPGEPHLVEPREAARPSRLLDLVFRTSELGTRQPRGLGGAHPGAHQVRGAKLQVRTEFLPQFRVHVA